MKSVSLATIFAGLAAAHSGVWTITIDGNSYPGRDARIDYDLGAKRIEWTKGIHQKKNPWNPVGNVESPDIACGPTPIKPELHAVARAGSNVTTQWSGIIKMHNGPVMTYFGYLPSPDAKPQDVKFFKIAESGWDPKTKLWANEKLINAGNVDHFQLPSDIKPGPYVLRTELVALHSNQPPFPLKPSPQFFTYCFNVEVTGDGTATPEGVSFPGAYKSTDSGVKFNLYKPGESNWDTYVIPGPPKYQGKYEAPKGPAPVVSAADRGLFPAEFQVKYDAYKAKLDAHSGSTAKVVNVVVPGGYKGAYSAATSADSAKLMKFYSQHAVDEKVIDKEFGDLKAEAKNLGII